MASPPARRLLIACKIFDREIRAVVEGAPVDVVWLEQGLHNEGPIPMRTAIQRAVDAADPGVYESVLLGYGFCGRGLEGLQSRSIPLIVPRAHDCLAMLIGNRAEYEKRVLDHPGTYWRSCGWIEQVPLSASGEPADQLAFGTSEASPYTWKQLVEKFGEEEALEIRATMTSHLKSYDRIAFIETGVEPDGSLLARAKQEAASKSWTFERIRGDLGWIRRLAHGPWSESEFLTVPAGSVIAPAFDGSVILCQRPDPDPD